MPAVRIAIPLMAGIYSGYVWPQTDVFHLYTLLGISVVLWIVLILKFRNMHLTWIQGAAMLIWLLVAGGWMMQEHLKSHASPADLASDNYQITGLIDREPVTTRSGFRLKVKVLELQSRQEIFRKPFFAWVYPTDILSVHQLIHGDTIRLQGNLRPLTPAMNPGDFDFERWSRMQGVQATFRQSRQDTMVVLPATGNYSIVRKALQVRQQQIDHLTEYLPDGRELAIVMAILLGKRDEIDHSLRQAYADTGAVHVLAVSGLHVGIVAFVLQWLLGLIIPKFNGDKWLRLLLNLLGIWAFAFVTGLPPSVQRASIMFSLFIIGTTLQKRRNGYNTLAVAAIIMLLINPLLLFDVGFQLSFSAVWGILFFFPRIYPLLTTPVQWLDATWSLLSVSMAATIGTLPFTLYYFQQFPVLFWLSGLVVIPAATVIVWLGIGLLVFANLALWVGILSYPASLASMLLYAIIWLMNAIIFSLQSLPGAVVKLHAFDWVGMSALLFSILALAIWIKFKTRLARVSFYIAFCLLGGWYGISEYKAWHQAELAVYHTRSGHVADLLSKRSSLTIYDVNGSNHMDNFRSYRSYRKSPDHQEVELQAGRLIAVRFAGRQILFGDIKAEEDLYSDVIIPFNSNYTDQFSMQHSPTIVLREIPEHDSGSDNLESVNLHNLSTQGAFIQNWK